MKGARASRTTIALKLAMALSGVVFVGFVLVHMYGNLKACLLYTSDAADE